MKSGKKSVNRDGQRDLPFLPFALPDHVGVNRQRETLFPSQGSKVQISTGSEEGGSAVDPAAHARHEVGTDFLLESIGQGYIASVGYNGFHPSDRTFAFDTRKDRIL
jgi:hypothetical protein